MCFLLGNGLQRCGNWFLVLFFCCQVALLSAQDVKVDSLKETVSSSKGIEKVEALLQISRHYSEVNTTEALYYGTQAHQLAADLDALPLLTQASLNLGALLRNKGQSGEALDYFLQAMQLARQTGDARHKADALHKIGVTHLLLRDFQEAENYILQEVEIWKELKDQLGLAAAYNALGLVYVNTSEFAIAKDRLEASLSIYRREMDLRNAYKPLINLGDMYLRMGQPDSSLSFIQESLQLSKRSGNKYGLAVTYLKLGEAYRQVGEFSLAIEAVRKGLRQAEDLNYLSLMRNSYESLSKIYEESKDFASALLYHKLYLATKDTLDNRLTQKKVAEVESSYRYEKQTQEIEFLSRQRVHDRNMLIAASVVILVVAIAFGTLLSRYRSSQLTKMQLVEQEMEIERQKREMLTQNTQLEKKNVIISETVDYAQKMMASLLPDNASFMNIFSDHFVLDMPRDELSGDFYWYTYQGGNIMIVVADCTGHGVPGAINTLIINSLLIQIVNESQFRTPADILKEVHSRVLRILSQEDAMNIEIGCDMSIVSINPTNGKLMYAGANIPLYLINAKAEMHTVQPDKVPLGGSRYAVQRQFNNHRLTLSNGDRLYMMTDGYEDQFGGKRNSKFLSKKVRGLIDNIKGLPLPQQRSILNQKHIDWKGDQPQTDDIMVFGLEI